MFRTKTIHADAQFPGFDVQYTGNAMPTRPAKHNVRNLTGLYLGTEGEKTEVKKGEHLIPSLGRGRGMPSQKIRTPTEERRYKKVELLRIKEEKRGFSGNLLKRRQMIVEPDSNETHHRHAFYESQHPITFWDITRQTPRKFTAANNSGVTHLEYLSADHTTLVPSKEANDYVVKTMAKEIQEAALDRKDIGGVIECYNRICRGNVEALFSLLPPKVTTHKSHGDFKRTGFSVKSYRNPNKAEIMASFPEGEDRPKTVLGTTTRPQVPSPYFYKNYDQPKTAMDRYRDINYTPYSEESRIQGAPGTGQLSRSVSRGRQNTSPRANTPLDNEILKPVLKKTVTEEPELPVPTTTPRQGSVAGATDTETEIREDTEAISVPGVGEDFKSVDGIENSAENNSNNNAAGILTDQDDSQRNETHLHVQDMTQSAAGNRLEKMPSGTDIIIGVEDEKGELKPVEIDETDDQLDDEVSSNGSVRRKVSITERILKSKNSEEQAAHLQQEAINRKKQLEELLDEHAQLVQEVDRVTDNGEQQENKENQQ